MSDTHPAHPARAHETVSEDKRGFFQRLADFINPGPDTKEALIELLSDAEENALIGADSRVMLERVIRMADMTAGDVLVAAPRMDMIDIAAPLDEVVRFVIETAHSRFPVYEGERSNVIGTLMAKDLIQLQHAGQPDLRALLRPTLHVPESKGLHDLLREFRARRNHLAIVVDEFGSIAGLVTIEDVLEQIVGEIEDEYDLPEDQGDIVALADASWRVSGDTPVARVEEVFAITLTGEDPEMHFDTIGGLVAHEMGYLPRRGEECVLGGLRFRVLLTKGGVVRWFKVVRSGEDGEDA